MLGTADCIHARALRGYCEQPAPLALPPAGVAPSSTGAVCQCDGLTSVCSACLCLCIQWRVPPWCVQACHYHLLTRCACARPCRCWILTCIQRGKAHRMRVIGELHMAMDARVLCSVAMRGGARKRHWYACLHLCLGRDILPSTSQFQAPLWWRVTARLPWCHSERAASAYRCQPGWWRGGREWCCVASQFFCD